MLARGGGLIVNNVSIGGYAVFPAVSTYTASKTCVVALSEALRRELRDTGVDVMSRWERNTTENWASIVVEAVERGEHVVVPGGSSQLARLGGRDSAFPLDPLSDQSFTCRSRT